MTRLPSVAVVIPCHDDCVMAERLVSSFKHQTTQPNEFVIAHDLCKDKPDSLRFGNKAATVNHYASIFTSDYVLVLDADMILTPTYFEALKLAFKNDEPIVGSGLVLEPRKNKSKIVAVGGTVYWYQYGGSLFAKRDFLLQHPMPVNSVVEDYAYGLQLKKRGIEGIIVDHAVTYMNRDNDTTYRYLRRNVRYLLGSLQAARSGSVKDILEAFMTLIGLTLFLALNGIIWGTSSFLVAIIILDVPVGAAMFLTSVSSIIVSNNRLGRLLFLLLYMPLQVFAFGLYIIHRDIW